jgi:integrase
MAGKMAGVWYGVAGMGKTSYAKDDIRYWQEAVYRETFRAKDGTRTEIPDYFARIQFKGRRDTFPLKTPNKAEAASRAREIYRYVVATGWDQTIAKFKPEKTKQLPNGIKTVGDFLKELELKADIKPKTLEGYAIAFRTIVASISGIPTGGRGGSKATASKWREKVHSVKLSTVTPVKVAEWKKTFLAKYPADPLSQRKARISVNSFLRRAKSLFAAKYLEHLPAIGMNPFQSVKLEPRQSQKYRSNFNVRKLIADAKQELEQSEPEIFKIFLLAVAAGLRRAEIDLLEWSAFKWEQGVIRIEPTKFFHPKSEDSIGDIEVDSELLELFKEFKSRTLGNFVIASPSQVQPRPEATFDHYRCTSLFEKLIDWLRGKGVTAEKPLHELRKKYGSQIASQHGIFEASRLLRHADITTTRNHYLDGRKRVTIGLGPMLTAKSEGEQQPKIVEGNF